MPSVTGFTSFDGDLTVLEVAPEESIQVWSLSLYTFGADTVDVLCGSRVVLTLHIPVLPNGIQMASGTSEPLVQGLKGEDLILRLVGQEVYYNIAYSSV